MKENPIQLRAGAPREKVHTVHQVRAIWLIDRDYWSARFGVHRGPWRARVTAFRLIHVVLWGQILRELHYTAVTRMQILPQSEQSHLAQQEAVQAETVPSQT